jgi:hypothetical protein
MADSNPDGGFGINHPGWTGGWQHETGMDVWKLNGTTVVDTITPTFSDACTLGGDPTPPGAGAVLLADMHVHETKDNDPMYCRTKVQIRPNVWQDAARSPQEAQQGKPIAYAPPDIGGDRGDRSMANRLHVPEYVLTWNGRLLKISPVASDSLPNPETWYRVFGGTTTEQKCAWPRRQ